jgi:8-amino-7-oxononanoate synthase
MKEPDFHINALSDRLTNGQMRKLEGNPEASFDFFSNDYLGFVQDRVLDSKQEGLKTGATGSRLLSGDSDLALETEQFLADYHKAEACLLFQSGYMANLGLLSCIARRADTIIYDSLVHASLRQAVQLSPASTFSFKHNDLDDLKGKIKRAKGTVFVVVEALYSMDGDLGALKAISEICKLNEAYLIVDEAHSTGIYGEQGRGLVDSLGLNNSVWARIHTFGKAAGVHGAAVLCSAHLKDFLVNFSKPFIYTTASSEHSLALIKSAYTHFKESEARKDLWEKVKYFEDYAAKLNLSDWFYPSKSPIKCLRVKSAEVALDLADELQKEGYMVKAIRYPTVPKGGDRIRICIHRHNSFGQISGLLDLISKLVK